MLPFGIFRLSQLSIKTRIETKLPPAQSGPGCDCLSQLSIKTRIETPCRNDYRRCGGKFESAIH